MAVVETCSWILLVSPRGILKCLDMRKDLLRVLRLPRIGEVQVRSLLGAPLNTPIAMRSGVPVACSESVPETKHEARKYAKKTEVFRIETPTLPLLLSMYVGKEAVPLTHETLAQIFFHSLGYRHVAVLDDYHSLVVAAVGAARGTENMFRIGKNCRAIHTLAALGLPPDLQAFPVGTPDICRKNGEVSGNNHQNKFQGVCPFPEYPATFLFVLAQKEEYGIGETLSLLSSAPLHITVDFLLYHPAKEGLLPLFNAMMQHQGVSLLDLREYFCREYQASPGATHPQMNKVGQSGFILTGTFPNM